MSAKQPRILVVNDDGIHAYGLELLERIARRYTDDVWVVAPEEERSGAGHSLSLTYPIRMRELDPRHFAIRGTPTDCALLGIHEILADRPPDLLISGINRGANLAEDITYSGTASAAMEGAMMGIPSIALSQVVVHQEEISWATAEVFAPQVLDKLNPLAWQAGSFVNVNFPNVPPEQVSGIRLTSQGMRPPGTFKPVRRVDERHLPYYWIRIAYTEGGDHPGTDLEAIAANAVSVTPMQLDMTDRPRLKALQGLFEG
jgi:5'-nucleotidase